MSKYLLLKDIPSEERPRERFIKYGPDQVTNAELIALLLRTGRSGESVLALAQRVLSEVGGLQQLVHTTWEELIQINGIGPAKAIQLTSGVELGRRISRALPLERDTIRSPEDAALLVMEELRFEQQEHFICLFLNTKHKVIKNKCIFKGTLNASVVHPREIFHEAIRTSSAALICVHNHPSGDPTPSREDLKVTERLVLAGQVMGIEVIDHIIIGDQVFYSMKEKGIIFDSK
ncbi:DNA repair protein RadC [Hazenella sp. IB182357]|uniref:DNA repair protein RadC n=1 Tax=Polycladospora coralii TaxID=2771432 RepID=A0A926NE50_9BACL|nr:DNA repair protein RadC [Polycladospora coralii]MBD1371778.1 DNA repair protein RadC [Polycladospora coralii]